MWEVIVGATALLVPAALVLWMIWPARTGAVAAGERGNEGRLPGTDAGDGGPVAPGE